MNKKIWLAAALLSLTSNAIAYDFTDVSPEGGPPFPAPVGIPESIELQATEDIPGDTIVLGIDPPLDVGDKIVFTLNDGATFADASYSLEVVLGGAGTGALDSAILLTGAPSGSPTIVFQMQDGFYALSTVNKLLISGSTLAGKPTNVNLPQVPGLDISLRARVFDSGNNPRGSAQVVLFESTLEPTPEPVPTLGLYGLTALALGSAGIAGFFIRRML